MPESLALLQVEAEYSEPRDKVIVDVQYREGDRVRGVIWALDWEDAHHYLCKLADAVADGAGDR